MCQHPRSGGRGRTGPWPRGGRPCCRRPRRPRATRARACSIENAAAVGARRPWRGRGHRHEREDRRARVGVHGRRVRGDVGHGAADPPAHHCGLRSRIVESNAAREQRACPHHGAPPSGRCVCLPPLRRSPPFTSVVSASDRRRTAWPCVEGVVRRTKKRQHVAFAAAARAAAIPSQRTPLYILRVSTQL